MTPREAKRKKERIEREAGEFYNACVVRFLEFTQSVDDIQSQEVVNRLEEFNIGWRHYCGTKKLIPEAFNKFNDEMQLILSKMIAIEKSKPFIIELQQYMGSVGFVKSNALFFHMALNIKLQQCPDGFFKLIDQINENTPVGMDVRSKEDVDSLIKLCGEPLSDEKTNRLT
jgi:hypothetical protein